MALTFQYGSVAKTMPKVSYIKSIDVWILMACLFVFSSLVELAIVGYIDRVSRSPKIYKGSKKRKKTKKEKQKKNKAESLVFKVSRDP